MKKMMCVMASVLALSGCASIFDPSGASSKFSCVDPDNPNAAVDGATCKTPFAIYQSTHEEAPLKQSDLPIGVTLEQYERGAANTAYASDVSDQQLMDGVYHSQGYQVPGQMMPADRAQYVRPVRVPAAVMRVWLAPWIDANDDLHFPSHVYTEIAPRRWAFGEREFAGRGMAVPTRPVTSAPVSRVAENDRLRATEPQQLQPYQPSSQPQQSSQPQPIGTGTEMPTLP